MAARRQAHNNTPLHFVTYKQAREGIGVAVKGLVVMGGKGLGNFFGGHDLDGCCICGNSKWGERQGQEALEQGCVVVFDGFGVVVAGVRVTI